MGITQSGLSVLAKYPSKRVLSLGYPDIIAPSEVIERLFNVKPLTFVDNGAWHRVDYDLPETEEFFRLIGSELSCVDVHSSRGMETITDLNYPQDLGKYDMVIDPGTIEHCFNIGQAMINAANAVCEGGVIFHSPPISMLNHGFFNLCPTLFYDFYTQNGWEIEMLFGVHKEGTFELPSLKRVTVPPECSMYCVARRTHMRALSYPTQSKYLEAPNLKSH